MSLAVLTHVWLDDKGVAWVDDTNTKVIEIVLDHTAWGWPPEEIHRQHPHLSLAQIHAALAYYFDHRREMDSEIARQEAEIDRMETEAQKSPFQKKLEQLAAARYCRV